MNPDLFELLLTMRAEQLAIRKKLAMHDVVKREVEAKLLEWKDTSPFSTALKNDKSLSEELKELIEA